MESGLLPHIDSFEEDFSGFYGKFIDILRNAMDRASGRGRGSKLDDRGSSAIRRKVIHKWWDGDCDRAVRDRGRAFAAFNANKSIHAWIEYKRLRAVARKIISSKKKKILKNSAQALIDLPASDMSGISLGY